MIGVVDLRFWPTSIVELTSRSTYKRYWLPLTDSTQCDVALVDYANFFYFEGSPVQEFSVILVVFRDKYPEYSRHGSLKLPRAQRSLQGLLKRDPLHKRPSASFNLITLIVIDLAIRHGPIYVLGLILMYGCFIRPGELFKMAIEDVAPKVQTSDHVAIILFPGEREGQRERERKRRSVQDQFRQSKRPSGQSRCGMVVRSGVGSHSGVVGQKGANICNAHVFHLHDSSDQVDRVTGASKFKYSIHLLPGSSHSAVRGP